MSKVKVWLSVASMGLVTAHCKTLKSDQGQDAQVAASLMTPLVDAVSLPPNLQKQFDFCPNAKDINYKNALYLSFLSANQYTHFLKFAPILGDLGFGTAATAKLWEKRGLKLFILRAKAGIVDANAGGKNAAALIADYHTRFGVDWDKDPDLHADASNLNPYDYEEKLVATVHFGEPIEFFTAGERDAKGFTKQSTQMVWAEHPSKKLVVITFRGTEAGERTDLLADADLGQIDVTLPAAGPVKFHRGFYNSYKSIEPLLNAKLKDLKPGTTVWITGHSLGAAVASMLTVHLMDRNLQNPGSIKIGGLYTFGSPRIGNEPVRDLLNFAHKTQLAAGDRFDKFPVVRVRNNADPVTMIPSLGYQHGGTLFYFAAKPGATGTLLTTRMPGQWDNASLKKIPNWLVTGAGPNANLGDHAIDLAYFPLLKRDYEAASANASQANVACDQDSGKVPAPFAYTTDQATGDDKPL